MRRFNITVNGKTYEVDVEEAGGASAPAAPAPSPQAAAPQPAAPQAPSGGVKVEAGVSGKVVNIAKNPGDSVTKGETVAILEAMKMEINVASPSDGTVSQVLVSVGDSVEPVTAIMTLA